MYDLKKMICILTSSKIDYFKESLNSVKKQQKINSIVNWDIFIIVNTLT